MTTEKARPLTDAQQQHLTRLNSAFQQVKVRLDEFVAYLRAEHETPSGEWVLKNLQVGFERVPKSPARKRTGQKPKGTGAAE